MHCEVQYNEHGSLSQLNSVSQISQFLIPTLSQSCEVDKTIKFRLLNLLKKQLSVETARAGEPLVPHQRKLTRSGKNMHAQKYHHHNVNVVQSVNNKNKTKL